MPDAPIAHELLPPSLPTPFQAAITAGPYNFECTDDENLRITLANSVAGVSVAIRGRIKRFTGEIGDIVYDAAPSSDRLATTISYPLGAGYLLNLSVFVGSGAPLAGQTFARLQLIRGRTGATLPIGTLLQGNITANLDRAWPGSPIESPQAGVVPRIISGTTPALGGEIAETVPTGARWELVSVATLLTTSAVALNRRPSLIIDGGVSQRYARSPQAQTLAASLSKTCYWMAGMPHETGITADALTAGLPIGVHMLAGHRFVTATESMNVGDQYGAPLYQAREWLEV